MTITGIRNVMSQTQMQHFIETRLLLIPNSAQHIEIAFFGGNFTGMPVFEQEHFLQIAHHFLKQNKVHAVRISTRPDYIDEEVLLRMKQFGVKNIELGAQSMCNDVLVKSGRGHSTEDTIHASKMITNYNFSLGLQMMIGLPGDNKEKSIKTAERIIALKAKETRIYPLIVLKDTPLFQLFQEGNYSPLSIEHAIETMVPIVKLFEQNNVKILRIGLHPSEEISTDEIVAGPWHQAMRQLVYTEIWTEILIEANKNNEIQSKTISVSPKQFQNAIGYKRKNKLMFPHFTIVSDNNLKGMNYEIDYH
jgi:histone acetyltransferase (RNA polymerase elongator complex component)